MLNASVKIFAVILLQILLITSHSKAFHKENSLTIFKKTEWDGNKENKKEYENNAKQKYCALDAKAVSVIEQGDPVINQNTGEQTINEDTGKPVFKDKKVFKIKLTGYHSTIAKKVENKKLFPSLASMNLNADWDKTKLVEILKMFCLQDSSKEERPERFKDSYLEEFYTQIALDNGFIKKESEKGDYNKKILEGELGDQILKKGLIINSPNAVWYVPDFLEKQEAKNIKNEKAVAKKAEEKRKAKAREKAIKEGNDQWISENKQNYIDKFGKKLNEYENKITKLKTKRDKLKTNVNSFETFMSNAEEDANNAIADLVNRDNQDIKDLREDLRDNIKIYLSSSDIKEYKDRFEDIEKINFDKYKNYSNLKKLIKEASKSKKATDFVGKEGWSFKFGKKTLKFTSKKIGFIQEFENIKSRDLGSGSVEDEKNIDTLNTDIQRHESNINEFINENVRALKALDEELGQRIPWNFIIMGIVALIIIISVGVYLYFQRKEMDELKKEAEEKVGSLKSELETKLKTTSDQIKSVSRTAARSSTSNSDSNNQDPIQEQPKTPEEIFAAKYDELVSDYQEALDDFSKVAAFKQKWHGVALSRKERQDGTKTILISSNRAFEKAEIWCVTFSEKYFAFPGSTVKSNMATYMNLDFEKAGRDFKGVFAISAGSNYSTEPSVLRRGGAGFVVERIGKIVFPA